MHRLLICFFRIPRLHHPLPQPASQPSVGQVDTEQVLKEGGVNQESGADMHTPPCVKLDSWWEAAGWHKELSSVEDWVEVGGGRREACLGG